MGCGPSLAVAARSEHGSLFAQINLALGLLAVQRRLHGRSIWRHTQAPRRTFSNEREANDELMVAVVEMASAPTGTLPVLLANLVKRSEVFGPPVTHQSVSSNASLSCLDP